MPEMGLQELSAVQNWQKKALKLQAIKMRQQITDNRLVLFLFLTQTIKTMTICSSMTGDIPDLTTSLLTDELSQLLLLKTLLYLLLLLLKCCKASRL